MIALEHHGPVALLRLQHGKANAVDVDLFDALLDRLDALEISDARAIVLTGQGSIFSACVDLHRVLEGGAGYLQTFLPTLSRIVQRLFAYPKPLVAAVNGHAIAGGCIIALACDRRLMAEGGGKMGVTELKVGVPFPVAPLEVLRFQVPDRLAQDLIYTGRLLGAEAALAAGLVDQLVPASDLLEKALQAAGELAELPEGAFAMTKRQLRQEVVERIAAREQELDDEILRIWCDPATLATIRAFVEATVGRR
jgi:enoyl-CoA hydratase/carnithine racemase